MEIKPQTIETINKKEYDASSFKKKIIITMEILDLI